MIGLGKTKGSVMSSYISYYIIKPLLLINTDTQREEIKYPLWQDQPTLPCSLLPLP